MGQKSKARGQNYGSGFHMIRSISVRNFRCFKSLELEKFTRFNIILGDNGSGKTSLLESIFMPLATGTEITVRLRQFRGLDGAFSGSPRRIEEALFGDFFYNNDMANPISLKISGDGVEKRSLEISRTTGESLLPFNNQNYSDAIASSSIRFIWTDAAGQEHPVTPHISQTGLAMRDTGEDMPDFYFFMSNVIVGSGENASRFSELSKANKQKQLVSIFSREYPWITDLNVEVNGGAPSIFATIRGSDRKVPLANISSGINKVLAFMIAIALRPNAIVLIDEIENGIHFSHLRTIWASLLKMARDSGTQLFISTHSKECLEALSSAAGKNVNDISLWRSERHEDRYTVKRFDGADFKAAMEYGQDIR